MRDFDGAAFDRWLTTDPRDAQDECPDCGDCEWVETDCGHEAWECHTFLALDGCGCTDVRTCRPEHQDLYHETNGATR